MIRKNNLTKNILPLYVFSIAKIVFPLLVLPYLTRVLSVDSYGMVAYVKAIMQYMQIAIDFGFVVSGTKDVVKCATNTEQLCKETSAIFFARIFVGIVVSLILGILTICIPILRNNYQYTILSFVAVLLTIALFDYVFRGLEKMWIVTTSFVVMKTLSTIAVFLFVKQDTDILLIPIFDIFGSIASIVFVMWQLRRYKVKIVKTNLTNIKDKLLTSIVYFLSSVATTAFTAFNTVIIGIALSYGEIACWSICLQVVIGVQAMFNPIADGIFPYMVKTKEIAKVKKTLMIMMPIIFVGCLCMIVFSKYILMILGGAKYISCSYVLQLMTFTIFMSFPAIMLGWPSLGSIDRQEDVTKTTVIASLFQVVGLCMLLLTGRLTLFSVAILRGITECVLMILRACYCIKYRNHFN